ALFTQANASGSNVAWLNSGSEDGDADYQSALSADKSGTPAYTLDINTEYFTTVAATAVLPSQVLDDLPFLESALRNLLLDNKGLSGKEEAELLNGAGT